MDGTSESCAILIKENKYMATAGTLEAMKRRTNKHTHTHTKDKREKKDEDKYCTLSGFRCGGSISTFSITFPVRELLPGQLPQPLYQYGLVGSKNTSSNLYRRRAGRWN